MIFRGGFQFCFANQQYLTRKRQLVSAEIIKVRILIDSAKKFIAETSRNPGVYLKRKRSSFIINLNCEVNFSMYSYAGRAPHFFFRGAEDVQWLDKNNRSTREIFYFICVAIFYLTSENQAQICFSELQKSKPNNNNASAKGLDRVNCS